MKIYISLDFWGVLAESVFGRASAWRSVHCQELGVEQRGKCQPWDGWFVSAAASVCSPASLNKKIQVKEIIWPSDCVSAVGL